MGARSEDGGLTSVPSRTTSVKAGAGRSPAYDGPARRAGPRSPRAKPDRYAVISPRRAFPQRTLAHDSFDFAAIREGQKVAAQRAILGPLISPIRDLIIIKSRTLQPCSPGFPSLLSIDPAVHDL